MDTNQIITQIDTEIVRLQEVKGILSGTAATDTKAKRGRSTKASVSIAPTNGAKRILSPEARARIVAAQKARWAKHNKAKKAA